MTDIDELRDRMATTPEAFGVRIAHDDLTALLDELAALRKAVVPVVDDEDRKLAQAVRDANARLHKGDDFDMELELAAQHIEAGRITTCGTFGYEIENDRLQAELAALRSAQQWRGIEDAKVNIGDGILAWDESCCGEPYIASLVKRGDVLEWFDGVCFREPVKFIDLSSFPLSATGADQ